MQVRARRPAPRKGSRWAQAKRDVMISLSTFLRLTAVVAVCATALAGCGVNGPLEPPGGVAAVEKKADAPAASKAHKSFLLDGIL